MAINLFMPKDANIHNHHHLQHKQLFDCNYFALFPYRTIYLPNADNPMGPQRDLSFAGRWVQYISVYIVIETQLAA